MVGLLIFYDKPVYECVIYEKLIDTHGMVSITIPVTQDYKFKTWGGGWVERHCKAGELIGGIKRLVGANCPGYSEIKAKRIKK